MSTRRITLTLVLVAATLTGCATEAVSAPTNTPTPTSSATQSPTPTADPIDLADPSSWIISEAGIGPITLGQSVDDATLALSAYTPQEVPCDRPEIRLFVAEGAPSLTLYLAKNSPSIIGIRIFDYDSVLPAASSPHTAEGLGLGSTVSEVQAAYSDAVGEAAAGAPNYTHVVGDNVWISFSTLYTDETRILNIDVAQGGHMPYGLCEF